MKGFKKGISGNPNGKPKGVQNKIDVEAKKVFLMTLEKQLPNIESAFDEVFKTDKAKYLELYAKYVQYFIPKKTEIEGSNNIFVPIEIITGMVIK